MGWVGAQRDGALLKYAELLAARGYSSVRSVQPTSTAFSPFAGGRRRWALAMMAFLQQQALWPQRRLVFYAFSNGGAFVVEQLMLLADEDPEFSQLPQTVGGFIFDSAPAFMYPGALQRVVHSIEPPGLLRSLTSAYYSAASAAERLRWGPTRAESFWGHMLDLSWGRPLLYLYSEDDPLAHGARITELVAEKRRRGQDVRARCWDSSEHVGHLRRYREEYTRLLLGFLADCEAAAGSGRDVQGGGGLLRWIRHLRNNDVPLNACIALLLLAIVAVPALKRLAPHVYRKRRTAVLLVIRLVMAGCAAVATALPGQPAGVLSFVWMWAVGSNAAISFFIPQAWMLPSWLGAGLFVLHQAALAHLALARCDVLPRPDAAAQAARSFVAADRFGALEGITRPLDWPLFVLAPQASLQGSGLSPAGECLATTLWLQVTSALIAPAILLHIWSNGGKSSSSSRGSGSSSSRGSSGSSASYGSAYSQPGQLTALRQQSLRANFGWAHGHAHRHHTTLHAHVLRRAAYRRAHAAAAVATPAADLSAAQALDLVGFTLIVDDIVNPDGQSSMGRLGGGGPQTLWGFQLQRRQEAHVGLAAGVGPDLPAACLEQLRHYGIDTAGLVWHEHKTPRAWQILEEDGRRHEIWRTPFTPQLVAMLRPSLAELPPAYQAAKYFHVGVHPQDTSLPLLRELRAAAGTDGLVSAETFAAASAAVPAADLRAFMSQLDVFSPNEAEAASMLRWQLQQAGKQEERTCRFCFQELPDWRTAHEQLPKATPVMTVVYNNQTHSILVQPGPEGEAHFIQESAELSLSFGCRLPGGQGEVTLEGSHAFGAAAFLASLSAGERQQRSAARPLVAEQVQHESQQAAPAAQPATSRRRRLF
ncbi:26S proteasome regulatory subunit [Chlorella sorokiniana]|uniref:26S proteasome regulatory subunit n=1 Tax=Chlorella sorokiniana TaxID=3076 RepID=A0A2P6TE88_CHLSO|nr:26S proteasome regulatory subunit [Chlorella sorokiniana]|eukprot:PRW20960.1 26S proteasome regulatory subunit [Chlorella sorokiniana]